MSRGGLNQAMMPLVWLNCFCLSFVKISLLIECEVGGVKCYS